MPFFQYLATDRQGKAVQGTLQAATLDEASLALMRQGYQVTSLLEPGRRVPPVASQPIAESPAQVRIHAPSAKSVGATVKTRYTRDAEVFFLFSQFAAYFKSGINPAQAFQEIGRKQTREDIRDALLYIGARVGEGASIADHMERYPYLFPPHAVGAVRAGESGGYLPEAMESVAKQADSSRKLRRWMVWLGWFAVGIPPVIPIGKALFNAVLGTWSVQDASGGTTPVGQALWPALVKEFTSPVMLMWLVFFGLCVVAAVAWQSMGFRKFRHRLALAVPTIGSRAKAESFASFTWNLANLSKAAIAPGKAFQLATEAVPNEHIRSRLREQGARMTDRTKLSEALEGTRMLPYELSAMVQTGEVTGDVAGQLFNGARTQQEEFDHHDRGVKNRVGCWMAILFFMVGPLVAAWLYRDFLLGLFRVFEV